MSTYVDEHCDLNDGKLFQDYHCLLNQIDGKSDKFYLIQLLTNADGCYVWTRWGKNGTSGQNKLEGPTEQAKAIKSFGKKFHDKTKNKWENRSSFVPAKGKYTLVPEASKSDAKDVQQANTVVMSSLEAEKPTFPETVVSGKSLHADILYQIMFCLSTKDVLICMQVCKFWKVILSEKYFWKMFIYHQFDLALKSDISEEWPLGQWANSEEWFCYYDNEDDPYVVRPFPSMWNCGVIHPFGLDPMSGDVKSLLGFSRSLEILTHMRKTTKALGILSGNECSGNEGSDDICVVLFPWDDHEELPSATTILTKIFHFHPEICQYYLDEASDSGERRSEELYYHLPNEDADDDDDEREEHDLDKKPCLNRIFGYGWFEGDDKQSKLSEAKMFYAWLQKIMVPTITVYAGADKLNPVVVFFLTNLAPGWVGGALTGVTYT